MKFSLIGVLLTLLVRPSMALAELVLMEDGASMAPIVLFENAPPRTRDAAEALADYFEKVGGMRPKVFHGTPQPLPETAVWVGFQPALKTLFPEVDFAFKNPEETLLLANDRHLVIAGRDRWNTDQMEAQGRLAKITGRQREYGTANAVYSFIRNHLGVRWLWPGELGEDFKPMKKIAFEPFEERYAPQIRARAGMFVKLSLGNKKEGGEEVWARRQRVQLDSLEVLGGHAFSEWHERYSKEHPEYFALQLDGTRGSWPKEPRALKLCDSNPAVWRQWLVEVEEQLDIDPGKRIFNVSPNDGWPNGHCVCVRCRAWDHPEGEILTWNWHQESREWPAITDRHVRFANELARLLKKRYPERDYFVQLHAYGLSRPAPVAAVPDDNVLISSVSSFHMRGDGVRDDRTKSMQQYDAWSKKTKNLAWRPNLGNSVGHGWGLPDISPRQAAADFSFIAERGCLGLFFDVYWYHWATQSPHYYILAHLAWDPQSDATAIMDEYYQRGFGSAAAEIQAYWEELENARNQMVAEFSHRLRAFDVPQKYTAEFFQKTEHLLDQAAAKLSSAPEKYARRVEFLRCGLDYAKLVVDTRAWMQKYESELDLKALKKGDIEAAAKTKPLSAAAVEARDHVLANWEKAQRMKEEFPKYAINWQPVFNKTDGKLMLGLHPDNPLSGIRLREFMTEGFE